MFVSMHRDSCKVGNVLQLNYTPCNPMNEGGRAHLRFNVQKEFNTVSMMYDFTQSAVFWREKSKPLNLCRSGTRRVVVRFLSYFAIVF